MPPPAYELVDVHVHQLEHESEPPRGLVVEDLAQLDDTGMRGETPQRLDLAQVVDLHASNAEAREAEWTVRARRWHGSGEGRTWSRESKWFFMHLMATYLPFLMHWALSTSEKVPSPFLPIRRYSAGADAELSAALAVC